MYQASIQEHTIDITDQLLADDIQFEYKGNHAYSAIIDGKQVDVDLVKIDEDAKQVVLRMAGKKYVLNLKTPIDLMLEKLGIKAMTVKKANNLKAPMPGLILKLLVEEGQTVKQGESLLVLEAMKMENVFKATADATIKSIKVNERQTVEKGEELITFA